MASSKPQAPHPIRVGIVLFPGFEPLDAVGPANVFGAVEGIQMLWIAEQQGPVSSKTGSMTVVASHSFAEMMPQQQQQQQQGGADAADPKLHWLLVPGGVGTRKEVVNPSLLSFLQAWAAPDAGSGLQLCMSVCTGAALLAAAGLLDGRRATSNKMAWEWVTSTGPKVQWVRAARWVADGPFLTSSGVTAGTDMAVAVLKTQLGSEVAGAAAKYNEYMPNAEADVDPFAEAGFVPDVNQLSQLTTATILLEGIDRLPDS
ncbi:hypothetical protein OEZ86_010087 [Tetradesmus obliquus]|uniref:DJ-1/PfpI domain-containing protein n=1 Tax=Tetradesmus obliquus TaxID=3088 RepID=A0ABY8UNQ8_TETOB|nr:hypothetical protein OEZ85_001522 [Tetradesmus obliquus]WIA43647.1 hypothetical protein OEZ86_010087 [Tetradesmus obliquus]